MQYAAYHSKDGYALVELPLGKSCRCIGKQLRREAGLGRGQIEVYQVPAKVFGTHYIKVSRFIDSQDIIADPKEAAQRILFTLKNMIVTKAALEHLEKVLDMDTRGKSTEQIRAEIVRLSEELPKGHALRDVPKSYPDRGQAIAAYTAVRQAIFHNTSKENSMAKKEAAAKPEKKAGLKAKGTDAVTGAPAVAPTVAGQEAKKEAKKPSKATSTKPAGPKKERVALAGPFKLSGEALKVKTPEELKLHEGSARHSLMKHILGSKQKSFTVEELTKAVGDQARQATRVMVSLGYLAQ